MPSNNAESTLSKGNESFVTAGSNFGKISSARSLLDNNKSRSFIRVPNRSAMNANVE